MEEKFNRRDFLKYALVSGSAFSVIGLPGCLKGQSTRVLNFFNYSDYIGKNTLKVFEEKFKSRVNYDVYSNQDILYAKIKIGVTGYDVVVATDNILRRFIKQNLLSPIEANKISNLDNLMKKFKDPPYDPKHKFSVPYLWGTTVVAYNKKYVKEPVDSWRILWDKKYKNRITMLDEKRDAIGATLFMLGYSGNDLKHSHIEEAKRKLLEQRPLIKRYTSEYQDMLITEESWISQAWSGDVIQAMRVNPNIDFIVPKEGSFIWVDNLCIPQKAPHLETAKIFINYILSPEVGAEIAMDVGYPTPNEKSYEIIKRLNPKMAKNPKIYPSNKVMKTLVFYDDLKDEEHYWNQIWEDVKLGKSN